MRDGKVAALSSCGSWLTGVLAILVIGGAVLCTTARAEWSQFRGPNRDGKAVEASGLLHEWPENGPEHLWTSEKLGFGFSSVSVGDGLLYLTGLEGKEGFIYALTRDGELEWKTSYGKAWTGAHPGTRTTPTYRNGRLYIMSGHGKAACYDAENGNEIWAVDTQDKFGGRQIRWGITESPLVLDDKVIFSPGGENAGVVALNPDNGQTVWVCQGVNDKSGYCSPIVIERGGKKIIVQLMAKTLIGIQADSGELLWRVEREPEPKYNIQAVHPVYADGKLYVTCGYGGRRGQMFAVSEDGTSVSRGWGDAELDCHHGGLVLLDGYIYGSSHVNNRNQWLCMNLDNGDVAAKLRGVGKGAVVHADGKLYTYGENGGVGLVEPGPDSFHLVSSFRLSDMSDGRGPYWAHPSISEGRLYLRHGGYIFAFDISAN